MKQKLITLAHAFAVIIMILMLLGTYFIAVLQVPTRYNPPIAGEKIPGIYHGVVSFGQDVEAGADGEYSDCTYSEIQHPISWADTEITITKSIGDMEP